MDTAETVSLEGFQVCSAWEESQLRILDADYKISHPFLLDVGDRQIK